MVGKKRGGGSIPRACYKVVAVRVRHFLALGLALKIDWVGP